MWNWVRPEDRQSVAGVPTTSDDTSKTFFPATTIQPWLDHITQRHALHPHHRQLIQNIYNHLVHRNQANRPLALVGASSLFALPFFPPAWFTDLVPCGHSEGLGASYVARFVPPYRLNDRVPERWDRVFLKGLATDAEQGDVDLLFATSYTMTLYGLTLYRHPSTPHISQLAIVCKYTLYGSLEDQLRAGRVPTTYDAARALALSITKRLKDLHWEYVHGNVHPRNILFDFGPGNVGDFMVDLAFTRHRRRQHAHRGGRYPYIAPEVATAVTAASDMYALGIILWQLVTRVTFPDTCLVDPHVFRIEPVPGILKEWQDLVYDCLQTDPASRPNAYTVYRRLEKIPQQCAIDPSTLAYIDERRQETQHYADTHPLAPDHTSEPRDDGSVWTASITRLNNADLQRFPSILH